MSLLLLFIKVLDSLTFWVIVCEKRASMKEILIDSLLLLLDKNKRESLLDTKKDVENSMMDGNSLYDFFQKLTAIEKNLNFSKLF